jgi:hypothetical protein
MQSVGLGFLNFFSQNCAAKANNQTHLKKVAASRLQSAVQCRANRDC